jgi:hypothetical protein
MKEICHSWNAGDAEFDHPVAFGWSRMTIADLKTKKASQVRGPDAFW